MISQAKALVIFSRYRAAWKRLETKLDKRGKEQSVCSFQADRCRLWIACMLGGRAHSGPFIPGATRIVSA